MPPQISPNPLNRTLRGIEEWLSLVKSLAGQHGSVAERMRGEERDDAAGGTIPIIDDERPMRRQAQLQKELVALAYELLDAHDDTSRIASEPARDLAWGAHLEYLRALQRKGREILAHMPASEGGVSMAEHALEAERRNPELYSRG